MTEDKQAREEFVDAFIRNLEEWDILPGGTYKPAFRGKLIGLIEWFDERNAHYPRVEPGAMGDIAAALEAANARIASAEALADEWVRTSDASTDIIRGGMYFKLANLLRAALKALRDVE